MPAVIKRGGRKSSVKEFRGWFGGRVSVPCLGRKGSAPQQEQDQQHHKKCGRCSRF